jgi:hypothetical protein
VPAPVPVPIPIPPIRVRNGAIRRLATLLRVGTLILIR